MPEERKQHGTVGWRFKSWAGLCVCTRYQSDAGFWMRVLEPADGHAAGETHCISERAVGRTYHLVREREKTFAAPIEHEQPCDCSVCKPERVP